MFLRPGKSLERGFASLTQSSSLNAASLSPPSLIYLNKNQLWNSGTQWQRALKAASMACHNTRVSVQWTLITQTHSKPSPDRPMLHLSLISTLPPSLIYQDLNQSDCNQARMLKGQRPPIQRIGTAAKGSFGGITSSNWCTMCGRKPTAHSGKHFSLIWMAFLSLKM